MVGLPSTQVIPRMQAFQANWNKLVTPWRLSYSGYLFHFSDSPVHKDTRNSSVQPRLCSWLIYFPGTLLARGQGNSVPRWYENQFRNHFAYSEVHLPGFQWRWGWGGEGSSFSGELAGGVPSAICTAYKMSKHESCLLHQCKPPMGSSTSAYF